MNWGSKAPLTGQAGQILAAAAMGEVDYQTGHVLINCISAFAGLRQVNERLRALEGQSA